MLDFAMISPPRLSASTSVATLLLATGCAHTNDSRPNVLLLVVDDLNRLDRQPAPESADAYSPISIG